MSLLACIVIVEMYALNVILQWIENSSMVECVIQNVHLDTLQLTTNVKDVHLRVQHVKTDQQQNALVAITQTTISFYFIVDV